MKVKNLHEQPHFLKTLSIGLVGYLQNVKKPATIPKSSYISRNKIVKNLSVEG